MLANDITRCAGREIHPEAAHWAVIEPECRNCARRTVPPSGERIPHMLPPNESGPCPYKLVKR